MPDDATLKLWRELEAKADAGGGELRQARQRKLGRRTARGRVEGLVDPGSFVELSRFVAPASAPFGRNEDAPGDGVICGLGAVEGRTVAVYANDVTVARGALGAVGARKVARLLDLALARRVPVVGLHESEGVRVSEGLDAVSAHGELLERHTRLSGVVPQVAVVLGVCVGSSAYAVALSDVAIVEAGAAHLFITGAKVTRVVTGEEVTMESLGGADVHARTTGLAALVEPSEDACIAAARRLLSYLPSRAGDPAPGAASTDPSDRATPELDELIPGGPRKAYDVRHVARAIVDQDSLLELWPKFAPNLLTFLARFAGRVTAIVASQPMHLGGCIDVDASRKGAHFVAMCGRFGLPIVTLVDVPGYLPGKKQEHGGILLHGAKLLLAYGRARVPRVAIVLRKSYGGANVLSFAADARLALPTARVAPMGAEAAFELCDAPVDPDDAVATSAREGRRALFEASYDPPFGAATRGYVDRVVAPSDLRRETCLLLARLEAPGNEIDPAPIFPL